MIDPREGKLPVWAQTLLEEQRTAAALAWPGKPDPAPLTKDNMQARIGLPVFEFTRPSAGPPRVIQSTVDMYGILRRDGAAHGSGSLFGAGSYYASEVDAWLAAWWMTCRSASVDLRRLQIKESRAAACAEGDRDA